MFNLILPAIGFVVSSVLLKRVVADMDPQDRVTLQATVLRILKPCVYEYLLRGRKF